MTNCIFNRICSKPKNICTAKCLRFQESDFLIRKSNIPNNYLSMNPLTPENIDLEAFKKLANIKNNITEFVNEGANLYLYSSNFGNGKTSWVTKLMLSYISKICLGNGFKIRTLFVNVPSFLTDLKNNIGENNPLFNQFVKNTSRVDLVVIDDIGAITMGNYDHSQLLSIIDTRNAKNLSTLYTSNLSKEVLSDSIGNRLFSRVYNSSVTIQLKGIERRTSKW